MGRKNLPHINTCKKKRGFQKSRTRYGQPPYMTSVSVMFRDFDKWVKATDYEKQEFIGRSTTITRLRKGKLVGVRFKGRLYVKRCS